MSYLSDIAAAINHLNTTKSSMAATKPLSEFVKLFFITAKVYVGVVRQRATWQSCSFLRFPASFGGDISRRGWKFYCDTLDTADGRVWQRVPEQHFPTQSWLRNPSNVSSEGQSTKRSSIHVVTYCGAATKVVEESFPGCVVTCSVDSGKEWLL